MATTTPKLALRKPAGTDNVDVSLDISDNMQKIDDAHVLKTILRLRLAASQSLTAATWTQVDFTADEDTATGYNATTDVYTIPRSGLYLVTFNMSWNAGTAGNQRFGQLYINSALRGPRVGGVIYPSGAGLESHIARVERFVLNDTVAFRAYSAENTALLGAAATQDGGSTWASIVLIGN